MIEEQAIEITQEQVIAYNAKRVKQCDDEITRILQRFGCELFAVIETAHEGRVGIPVVKILAK